MWWFWTSIGGMLSIFLWAVLSGYGSKLGETLHGLTPRFRNLKPAIRRLTRPTGASLELDDPAIRILATLATQQLTPEGSVKATGLTKASADLRLKQLQKLGLARVSGWLTSGSIAYSITLEGQEWLHRKKLLD